MLRGTLLSFAAVILVIVAEGSARLVLQTIRTPTFPKINRVPRDVGEPLLKKEDARNAGDIESEFNSRSASDVDAPRELDGVEFVTDSEISDVSNSDSGHRYARSILPDPTFPFPHRPTFPGPNPFPRPGGPLPWYSRERRNILFPEKERNQDIELPGGHPNVYKQPSENAN